MKKRFLASTLAILMATSAMSAVASAAPYAPNTLEDQGTDQDTEGVGQGAAKIEGTIQLGNLVVTVPADFTYVLNPYGLDVNIANPAYEAGGTEPETIVSNEKFLSKKAYIANKGDYDINVTIGLVAAPTDATSEIEIIEPEKLAAGFTKEHKQLKLGLATADATTNLVRKWTTASETEENAVDTAPDLGEGAIAEVSALTAWTVSTAATSDIIPATVVATVSEDSIATNYAAAKNTKAFTLTKRTKAAGAGDDEGKTIATCPTKGLQLIADVNDAANWKATDTFAAAVVWNIERNY